MEIIDNFWFILLIFLAPYIYKTLQNYFYFIEEVLNFSLVCHMWRLVKN